MSSDTNRFVLKEKSNREVKVIDFLSLFREKYGKDPIFASKTNYLANENARSELAVIHPDSNFASLFKGRIPSVDDLLDVEIAPCDQGLAYSLGEIKEEEIKRDYVHEINSQETQDSFNVPPISYFQQRKYPLREENVRNYRALESRLGGETYYARGRGISYRRAS